MTRTRITQARLWGNTLPARLSAKTNQRPDIGAQQKDNAVKNETEIMERLAAIERRLQELERKQLKRSELSANRKLKRIQRGGK